MSIRSAKLPLYFDGKIHDGENREKLTDIKLKEVGSKSIYVTLPVEFSLTLEQIEEFYKFSAKT